MPASITITGRLAREPEFRDAGNTRLALLTIPTDEGFGDRKTTTWWTCEVWGKAAERVENAHYNHGMYQKGDNVFVLGAPKVRTYTKKDGGQGFSADVNVFSVDPVFASKGESGGYGGGDSDSPPF